MEYALALSALLLLAPAVGVDEVEVEVEIDVKVLVVYHSVQGHTRAMAEAVAAGARSVDGTAVRLLTVAAAGTDDVLWADAIAVGSPVYNANVTPEVQSFINRWPFKGQPLRDKVGAAFVAAGAISAGEETAQLSLLRSMLVFGMVVAGGPTWRSAFGASAVTEERPFAPDAGVDEQFLAKGRDLGHRIAELAGRLVALATVPRPAARN